MLETWVFRSLCLYGLIFSVSIPLANLAIDLACGFSLLYCLQKQKPFPFPAQDKKLLAAPLSFVLFAALSGLAAINPADSLRALWFLFYSLWPLLPVLAFVRSDSQRLTLFRLMAFSLLFSSLFILWQGLSGTFKAAGPTGTWLIAAVYLELSIPFLLVFSLEGLSSKPRIRWGLYLLLGLCVLALLLVNSRAAWLAVSGSLLLYVVLRRQHFRWKHWLGLLVLLGLAGSLLFSQPHLLARTRSIFNPIYQNNSERLLMWQSSWNMFRDHPWFGVGTGNFKDQYQNRYIQPQARERTQTHAHNNLFQYLAETGLIGLGLFLYPFVFLLREYGARFFRSGDRLALAMLLSLSAFLIHGLMDWTYGMFPSTAQYLWFLVALTWRPLNGPAARQPLASS